MKRVLREVSLALFVTVIVWMIAVGIATSTAPVGFCTTNPFNGDHPIYVPQEASVTSTAGPIRTEN